MGHGRRALAHAGTDGQGYGGKDAMCEITMGRIYDLSPSLVWRVLVDRLWPRGIAKLNASWDQWMKAVAPSAELRRWYGHDPERWADFQNRYWQELVAMADKGPMRELINRADTQPLMLLTATKDIQVSHVPVLRDFLVESRGGGRLES